MEFSLWTLCTIHEIFVFSDRFIRIYIVAIQALLTTCHGVNNCFISHYRCSVTFIQTLMCSTMCLFTPTFPWRLTLPQWCWARRPTAIQTPFYSGRTTVISRLRRIDFWMEKAIILVVLKGDFGPLSGKKSRTYPLCKSSVNEFRRSFTEMSPKFRKPPMPMKTKSR